MSGVEWRYLAGGMTRHALRSTDDPAALCGAYTWPPTSWMGDASLREVTALAALRPCRSCLRRLGLDPDDPVREIRERNARLQDGGRP